MEIVNEDEDENDLPEMKIDPGDENDLPEMGAKVEKSYGEGNGDLYEKEN